MWRGAVTSAIKGKRGQGFLKKLLVSLDSMKEKCLIKHDLERNGKVCTLGAYGMMNGIDMSDVDPEDHDGLGRLCGIAPAMVKEIEFENDEVCWVDNKHSEAARFVMMRQWVVENIK